MPLTLPDILQRGAVLTSLAACGYGGLLIAQGFSVRAMRRREETHKLEQERFQFEAAGGQFPPPNANGSMPS
ncbi:uncharacterized protein MKK02DRAFT_44789 [Dioszegia hungarica]|uniref:Uncharacterized protein n=1 Tax=Dioszegia hungarica TaxID=4972 RepID=A0AA38LUZ7_9TREE|nr:uncharacterized protein MKK02DRAFT_44789 [Dioszegia hungarica]KAI9636088.1 hypothetical protein MKK02DRAFT_44789 [Dioszegia hungarica]